MRDITTIQGYGSKVAKAPGGAVLAAQLPTQCDCLLQTGHGIFVSVPQLLGIGEGEECPCSAELIPKLAVQHQALPYVCDRTHRIALSAPHPAQNYERPG